MFLIWDSHSVSNIGFHIVLRAGFIRQNVAILVETTVRTIRR